MRVNFKVRPSPNSSFINNYGKQLSRELADNAASVVQKRARANIVNGRRNWTGEMKDGIVLAERTGNQHYRGRVIRATARHSAYQEFGTRAHGPKKAKFLRFQIRGKGPFIFAKWVRGVTPLRYMERSAKSIRARDFLK